jgi:hypothetical protein
MLYPPSDFVEITIPADDGRGCGHVHRRPDGDGRPWQRVASTARPARRGCAPTTTAGP